MAVVLLRAHGDGASWTWTWFSDDVGDVETSSVGLSACAAVLALG